jgi:hypothetical protein
MDPTYPDSDPDPQHWLYFRLGISEQKCEFQNLIFLVFCSSGDKEAGRGRKVVPDHYAKIKKEVIFYGVVYVNLHIS